MYVIVCVRHPSDVALQWCSKDGECNGKIVMKEVCVRVLIHKKCNHLDMHIFCYCGQVVRVLQ